MRVLHTSDLHIGKRLRRAIDRKAEHLDVLSELVGTATNESVDVVVVAGDIFDVAAPPAWAEAAWGECLGRISLDVGIPVVVVAGNHDSMDRLAAYSRVLGTTRVHVVADIAGENVQVETRGGGTVAFTAVGYQAWRDVVRVGDADTEKEPVYADLVARRIATLAGAASPADHHVVVYHGTIAGGLLGGGERRADVDQVLGVTQTAFSTMGVAGVMCGHLHRPQTLGEGTPIRYSGSPLALDFGDTKDAKSYTIWDFDTDSVTLREVPVTAGRTLVDVTGATPDAIAEDLTSVGDAWVRVTLPAGTSALSGIADEIRRLGDNIVEVRAVPSPPLLNAGTPGTLTPDHHRTVDELFTAYLTVAVSAGTVTPEDKNRLLAEFNELIIPGGAL